MSAREYCSYPARSDSSRSSPSIFPLSIITRPCVKLCGRSTGTMSGAGLSGTVRPSCVFPVVAPSAPGYVPKYESKVRFSFTMNTTCWIGLPGSGEGEVEGALDGELETDDGGRALGDDPVHAASRREAKPIATTRAEGTFGRGSRRPPLGDP